MNRNGKLQEMDRNNNHHSLADAVIPVAAPKLQAAGEPSLPAEMPKELQILEAHNKMLLPIVTAIIQPLMNIGGDANDVMALLETIITGVIGSLSKPEAYEDIVRTLMEQVLKRLHMVQQRINDAKADAIVKGLQD